MGHLPVVQYLVTAGADVNHTTDDGPAPDEDDYRDEELTARVVVDLRFGSPARTSECYGNMTMAQQSLMVHQHIVDAARGGDTSIVSHINDTYDMVVDWVDRFKDADCGPVKVTVERMTF